MPPAFAHILQTLVKKLTIKLWIVRSKISWHVFCLYIDGACKSLEFLRQGLVKSLIGVMLKQSELSLLTITDDRIFIEKLANFSIKANAASRAVPVC